MQVGGSKFFVSRHIPLLVVLKGNQIKTLHIYVYIYIYCCFLGGHSCVYSVFLSFFLLFFLSFFIFFMFFFLGGGAHSCVCSFFLSFFFLVSGGSPSKWVRSFSTPGRPRPWLMGGLGQRYLPRLHEARLTRAAERSKIELPRMENGQFPRLRT